MFDLRLFGYDRNQVNAEMSNALEKIRGQQKDLDYLRDENIKLKKKMKQKKNKDIKE